MHTKHKIAVVEDELSLQELYKLKLEIEGFDVRVASNGEEGLLLAKAFQPKVILLDLMMPIMNGVEMLTHMRAQPWGGDPRVIILTNISKDEAPQTLRLLRVDAYAVKAHHTPSQIVTIIKDILRRS